MATDEDRQSTETLKARFRRNLKTLREAHDLTQAELSRACAYERSYMGKIERGRKQPSFEALTRIAEVFDVRVTDLFRRGDEENSSRFVELDRADDLSETLYETIFDNVSHMIAVLNPDYEIMSFNAPSLRLHIDTPEHILGKPLWETEVFVDPEPFREWILDRREDSRRGETLRRRVTVRGAGGEPIPIQYSLTPILREDPGGAIDFFISEGNELIR